MTRLTPDRKPRQRRERPPPAPLDRAGLDGLALAYLGRFATTRAKLAAYLARKLRERGWADEGSQAPIAAIVERMAALGYVDDRSFADARGRALARRGYGARRVGQALAAAGVTPEDSIDARAAAEAARWDSALAFARRRRIGPFAAEQADPDARRRAFAAMVRAGHGYDVVQRIIEATPGEEIGG